MAHSADIMISPANTGQLGGAGTNYVIQTPTGVYYMVCVDVLSDVSFRKSTDGYTWSPETVIYAGTVTALSVWYDRWSNISAGLIHCVYTNTTTDDTMYRTIDTENSDALSTETVVFAGTSTSGSGHLSVTRAVGGNVYCKTVIDGGAEGGFFRLVTANVPNGAWDAARTVDEAIAPSDQMILLPDLTAADNQDILAIFWDASASEISRKLYDDSADSWSETSIAGSMTTLSSGTAFPQFSAAVDLTNNQIILVAWTVADVVNADLLCWTITNSAITAVTDVVTNSGDDQGLAAVSIDSITGYWHVYYCGASDGSETFPTAVKVYSKTSTDSGTTWGSETLISNSGDRTILWLGACPWVFYGRQVSAHYIDSGIDQVMLTISLQQPRATYLIGI